MLHVCDACYSLKKGNDDVSIRSQLACQKIKLSVT